MCFLDKINIKGNVDERKIEKIVFILSTGIGVNEGNTTKNEIYDTWKLTARTD